MKKKVILRMLLRLGHMLEIIIDSDQAAKIMNKWAKHEYEIGYILTGYDTEQDRDYAVSFDEMQAMFTYDPQKVAVQQQVQPRTYQGPRISGN